MDKQLSQAETTNETEESQFQNENNSLIPYDLDRPVRYFSTTNMTESNEVYNYSVALKQEPMDNQDERSDSGVSEASSPLLVSETAQLEECESEPLNEALRIPKVNSRGKVKLYKCKQCDFIALTQLDNWKHIKSHIQPEKQLQCPNCPFVTEHKHHLQYHINNHLGSKPYKCDQCDYSCVNKSMLNSHIKSHSNVCQYRCANCNYSTKYCHALKIHLRKFKHEPAMVLNPDGTPNPLPVVDVYSKRRGPKVKGPKTKLEMSDPIPEPPVQNIPFDPFFLHPQLQPHFAGHPYFNFLRYLALAQQLNAQINGESSSSTDEPLDLSKHKEPSS